MKRLSLILLILSLYPPGGGARENYPAGGETLRDRAEWIAGNLDDFSLAAQVIMGGIDGNVRISEPMRPLLERIPLGVNLNLAPVAEPLTGENRLFLESRSHGADPAFVAGAAEAFIRGMEEAGVACAVKHFPGNTGVDPHRGRTVLGADRGELGFQGVILADDFSMAGADRGLGPGEAAVAALAAGADMVMVWPIDLNRVHRAIMAALTEGRLKRERLLDTAARIIAEKLRFGLAGGPEGAPSGTLPPEGR